jgi:hypothetical protein
LAARPEPPRHWLVSTLANLKDGRAGAAAFGGGHDVALLFKTRRRDEFK